MGFEKKTSGLVLVSESTPPSHKPALLGLMAGSGAGAGRIQDGPGVSSSARKQGWVRKQGRERVTGIREPTRRAPTGRLGQFEQQSK